MGIPEGDKREKGRREGSGGERKERKRTFEVILDKHFPQ